MLSDHDDRSREVRGIPGTATLGDHPIHPMLVPFPLAFLGTVACTDLAYLRSGDPFWARASGWLLRAGVASGAAAGVVGAADWLTIERARSRPAGMVHAAGNLVVLGLALASLERRRRHGGRHVDGRDMALSAGLAALLGVTGWFGGELAYRHGIGVAGEADPEAGHEGHGRAPEVPARDGNPRWGRAPGASVPDGGVRYGRAAGVPETGGHSRYGRARGVSYQDAIG